MKNKRKEWNKKASKIGLVLTLTALLFSFLAPLIGAGGGTTTVTGQVTVNTACVFTANVAKVQFGGNGGITAGQNTGGTNTNTIGVTNTGDATSNIFVYGTAWSWATLSVTNTIYSSIAQSYFVYPANVWSNANAYNGNEIALTTSQEDSMIPVNTLAPNSIFVGLNIPAAVAGGSYSQTIDLVSSC